MQLDLLAMRDPITRELVNEQISERHGAITITLKPKG